MNGDIILDAKNIQIRASDPNGGYIHLNATKIIELIAPNVKTQGEYISVNASAEYTGSAASHSTQGEFANNATQATEEDQSSFLGKILNIIKKVKKFFTNTCSD